MGNARPSSPRAQSHPKEGSAFSAVSAISAVSQTMERWAILVGLALLGASACTAAPAPRPEQPATLVVAAAANLQFAFEEVRPLFEKEARVKVEFTFGSSGNLARQIENGAPIDVFASADEAFVDELEGKGLVLEDTRQVYAFGRLALVSNRKAGLDLKTLQDLASPGIKHVAIANPEIAPYGRAARQALERAGVWDRIVGKVVYGEDIRQALQYVQTGNAEAGIVALSIADVPEVTYTLVDQGLHEPLRQEMAVIRRTQQEGAARKFSAFVRGPQGGPILKKYGFSLPEGP